MATYDSKPSIFEANGNGSYTYRWDIKEIQVEPKADNSEENAKTIQWECQEVIVWATVTRSKLTEAVITSIWESDYEQKLINDYNGAKEGVFGDPESDEALIYINRYKDFLKERKTIKEQIQKDCEDLNII